MRLLLVAAVLGLAVFSPLGPVSAGTLEGDPPIRCPEQHLGLAGDAGASHDASPQEPVYLPGAGTYVGCVDGWFVETVGVRTEPLDHADVYVIPAAPGDRVRATFAPTECFEASLWLQELRDGEQVTVDASTEFVRRICDGQVVSGTAQDDEGFLLWVIDAGGERGHYQFVVEVGDVVSACDPQDDGGSGADAGASPVSLSPGAHSGCLDGFEPVENGSAAQRWDRYEIPAPVGHMVRVTATPKACHPFFGYLDGGSKQTVFGTPWDHDYETCEPVVLGALSNRTGTVGFGFSRFGGEIPYDFQVEVGDALPRACAVPDDAGSGTDGTWKAPVHLPRGENVACVDEFDRNDFATFHQGAAEPLLLRWETVSGDCWYVIAALQSAPFWSERVSSSVPACQASLLWVVPATGEDRTMHWGMARTTGSGAYRLLLCDPDEKGTEGCTVLEQ